MQWFVSNRFAFLVLAAADEKTHDPIRNFRNIALDECETSKSFQTGDEFSQILVIFLSRILPNRKFRRQLKFWTHKLENFSALTQTKNSVYQP